MKVMQLSCKSFVIDYDWIYFVDIPFYKIGDTFIMNLVKVIYGGFDLF